MLYCDVCARYRRIVPYSRAIYYFTHYVRTRKARIDFEYMIRVRHISRVNVLLLLILRFEMRIEKRPRRRRKYYYMFASLVHAQQQSNTPNNAKYRNTHILCIGVRIYYIVQRFVCRLNTERVYFAVVQLFIIILLSIIV